MRGTEEMANSTTKKKANLLVEAAKKKAEAQAQGKKSGVLGKDLSKNFQNQAGSFFTPRKPGGRNGQGKPS